MERATKGDACAMLETIGIRVIPVANLTFGASSFDNGSFFLTLTTWTPDDDPADMAGAREACRDLGSPTGARGSKPEVFEPAELLVIPARTKL